MFFPSLAFYGIYALLHSELTSLELATRLRHVWLLWFVVALTSWLIPPESGRKIKHLRQFFEWDENGEALKDEE